jgi:hypothetical protein
MLETYPSRLHQLRTSFAFHFERSMRKLSEQWLRKNWSKFFFIVKKCIEKEMMMNEVHCIQTFYKMYAISDEFHSLDFHCLKLVIY